MEDKDKQGEKKWYILDRGSLSLLIVLLAAILFYVGLTNFDVIAVRVRTFMGVLTPFIAGFAIAYLLNTPMCFFERKLYQKQKHRRGLAILGMCAGVTAKIDADVVRRMAGVPSPIWRFRRSGA